MPEHQQLLFAGGKKRHYPDEAGFKVDGPSREAARSIDAATIRAEVLRYLRANGALTADEIATGLKKDRLSIRPRVTELKALGEIIDTKNRRLNASGKSATVWKAVAA